MPAQLTTRAQVNGYRFLLRRLDHALVRRDVRMLHDPMRSQTRSLIAGAVLGLLVVAGCAILAFLRPQGAIGNAKIVMGKDSGAVYVLVPDAKGEKVLHPALNLASARLITGSNETPTSVKDVKLGSLPRGPILGIPGAPAALPGSKQGDRSDWTLCDQVRLSDSGSAAGATQVATTVLAGQPRLSERMRVADKDAALLVKRNDKTYLIYGGQRAEVDPQNTVMARTLGLTAHPARPVSTGLIDVATEVPALTPPTIARAGEPGPGRLSSVPIGGVIRVASLDGSDRSELYVVLADGVQRISPFTAQVIRFANAQGMSDVKAMPPDVLDGVQPVHELPVDRFPDAVPKILSADDAPVACLAWSKAPGNAPGQRGDTTDAPSDRAGVTLLAGTRLPLADSEKPVTLTTATGTGEHVDAVYIPPASGEFVQATGVATGSPRRDALFYVADNGVRYGVPDLGTAEVLGLGRAPKLAPWEIVGQLVPGPTLSKDNALTSYDALPTGSGQH
ncbi:type VII secretion protein EccB [Nocardia terpenica]|uniref:type VII secretion protein EccB n=1 Tax=Nocardia terpenica TaxID=455432 RepID=UPI001893B16B|nr:type VII secretion protein EccB [Nocardia terpenica]MBF6061704.1 type VII secretion protein EccB [Nocardia terpenica]MBF6107501.1 type VII secretion protein EccB [Nocardia terpenica]MBF6110124.1 type VII secretion protein EccB [Nocardia terpenica]MBF6122364.1 type VII secretion protein EccB [Nocardia terpenica]MBF6151460.1 type VII secretion protein EccB [Nocardia terpenica]